MPSATGSSQTSDGIDDESVVENEFKLVGLHGLVCYLYKFKKVLFSDFITYL